MSTLQFRRGVAANRSTVTPAVGEPLFTTDTKQLFVGDGATAGGIGVAPVNSPAFTGLPTAPTTATNDNSASASVPRTVLVQPTCSSGEQACSDGTCGGYALGEKWGRVSPCDTRRVLGVTLPWPWLLQLTRPMGPGPSGKGAGWCGIASVRVVLDA